MPIDRTTALAIARKVLRSVRHCGSWEISGGDVYPVNIKDVDLAKIIEQTIIRKPYEKAPPSHRHAVVNRYSPGRSSSRRGDSISSDFDRV